MRLLTLVLISAMTGTVWASNGSSAGQLKLKLNDKVNDSQLSVRQARQRLVEVEKEIASLERQIVDARNQAQVASVPANNFAAKSNLQAVTGAYEMQKATLAAEREQLIEKIKSN